MNSKLFFEIIKGIKSVICVKVFIAFFVGAFDFAVVLGVYGLISLCETPYFLRVFSYDLGYIFRIGKFLGFKPVFLKTR